MFWWTFLVQIFFKLSFCLRDNAKIVRLLLAAVSINGLSFCDRYAYMNYARRMKGSLFLCASCLLISACVLTSMLLYFLFTTRCSALIMMVARWWLLGMSCTNKMVAHALEVFDAQPWTPFFNFFSVHHLSILSTFRFPS